MNSVAAAVAAGLALAATGGTASAHLTLVSGIADALDEARRLHTLRPPYN